MKTAKTITLIRLVFVVVIATTLFSQAAISADSIKVDIVQFKYQPAKISVKPGDEVVFTNKDIVNHTATADDGSWDTGDIAPEQSQSIIFTNSMDVNFFCFYHQAMKASFAILE